MLERWVAGHSLFALLALVFEAWCGYPDWLYVRIAHPVVWAGNAISAFERWWNEPQYSFASRRLLGCVAVLIVTGAAVVLGSCVEFVVVFADRVIDFIVGSRYYVASTLAGAGHALGLGSVDSPLALGGYLVVEPGVVPWGGFLSLIVLVLVATVGLAQRSLYIHVKDVLTALRFGDLPTARERVSLIVGRDTSQLDTSGVSGAALESLAESFNDGIVAPALWLALGGLPGLFAYKVINTADSLIGHKEARWRAFGWAAARADDVANLVPARIAGTLLTLAGFAGLFVMFKDASKHASPNAGWPEAAMAGALGVRLGGPATYDGVVHERPVFGTGPAPELADLGRGLRIYVIACGLLWLLVATVFAYTDFLSS